MKKLALALLLAWFFGFRMESDTPGVFVSLVQGPYKTRAACEKDYNETLKGMQSMFGSDFIATGCKENI